ncbi:MAG: HAMP domain-containing protein [Oscillospiraceae bacterium]|nr:HAMP domain-containing protein [Oscillospiraceae bacterium]
MRRGLRTQLTATIALIVLITIALISVLANVFINREFENYAREQRTTRCEDIVANLNRQYNMLTGKWDTGYIHGVGMYALYEGYVIRVYDKNGQVVWDAENHDMSLCGQIMQEIADRMARHRPGLDGGFTSQTYELAQSGQTIGKVAILSYGPYFLNENDFRFLSALNLILVIVGLLSLALSMVAGGALARRISRPITKTVQIATQISGGDYAIRFEGQTRAREIDELAAAMNHMATSLESQEGLRRRLTTDMAHELRTPLSAVAAHLEMMMEGVWQPTQDRLKGCYEEIGRIAGLVTELEKLAQAEDDNLRLHKKSVDLLALARTVSGNFESESAKKNIRLLVEGEATMILADRDRLHRVVANLLSNAIKYTPEGGHIRVAVQNTPHSGVLLVEDDGIGIPAEELPLIFERFYRTDKSRNRKTGGAGIGLTIAKAIVTAHGGKIEAQSAPNRGSRFVVTLPRRP